MKGEKGDVLNNSVQRGERVRLNISTVYGFDSSILRILSKLSFYNNFSSLIFFLKIVSMHGSVSINLTNILTTKIVPKAK